jgi:hypothetical protein
MIARTKFPHHRPRTVKSPGAASSSLVRSVVLDYGLNGGQLDAPGGRGSIPRASPGTEPEMGRLITGPGSLQTSGPIKSLSAAPAPVPGSAPGVLLFGSSTALPVFKSLSGAPSSRTGILPPASAQTGGVAWC